MNVAYATVFQFLCCFLNMCLITYRIIMSPHNKIGRHIVFSSVECLSVIPPARPSVRLSVCLSVCPSRFCARSISFETLVLYTNYYAQMSSMMSRCAVRRFDRGRFKVKVKNQD